MRTYKRQAPKLRIVVDASDAVHQAKVHALEHYWPVLAIAKLHYLPV